MTAQEFIYSYKYAESSSFEFEDVEKFMVAFAKSKVEEAIAEIARAEANSIEEANEDKEYMLNLYPLENIK